MQYEKNKFSTGVDRPVENLSFRVCHECFRGGPTDQSACSKAVSAELSYVPGETDGVGRGATTTHGRLPSKTPHTTFNLEAKKITP